MGIYEETAFLLAELSNEELLCVNRLAAVMAGRLDDEPRSPAASGDLSEVWVGKKVKFGCLSIEEPGVCSVFFEYGPELTWTVLDMRFDAASNPECKALILSDAPVDARTYDSGQSESFWGGSRLRSWLNGEFVASTFWSDEAQRIVETGHEAHGGAPLIAMDRVFLLSEDELQRHLPDPANRILEGEDGVPVGWWLRSDLLADRESLIPYVDDSGHISHVEPSPELIMGVRPALWISLKPEKA